MCVEFIVFILTTEKVEWGSPLKFSKPMYRTFLGLNLIWKINVDKPPPRKCSTRGHFPSVPSRGVKPHLGGSSGGGDETLHPYSALSL